MFNKHLLQFITIIPYLLIINVLFVLSYYIAGIVTIILLTIVTIIIGHFYDPMPLFGVVFIPIFITLLYYTEYKFICGMRRSFLHDHGVSSYREYFQKRLSRKNRNEKADKKKHKEERMDIFFDSLDTLVTD